MVQSTYKSQRSGVILIIVLVVLVVLSLSAYTFCDLMVTHKESAMLSGRQMQARALVDSGTESVKLYLAQPRATRMEAGGTYNNEAYFRGIIVLPDANPKLRGCFTVLAPNLDESGNQAGARYGLQDESARLNLNALLTAEKTIPDGARTLLMALPGMTVDTADAIMDWLDTDEEPREYGAEADYYAGLTPPYAPKNGPLETVEELLLVRGVTPQLLFGLDSNRNGTIDPHEQTGADPMGGALPGAAPTAPTGTTDPLVESGATNPAATDVQQLGWSAYLTLFSQERNVDSEGNPRINLNEQDLTLLHEQLVAALGMEWANFIVAYRQSGPYTTGTEKGVSASTVTLDLTKPGNTQFSQILDLIGQRTQVQGASGMPASVLEPAFPLEGMGLFLPKLMDKTTTVASETIPGRININQAPRAILMGIPGLTEEVVAAILERRQPDPSGDNPNRYFETWLAAEAIVTIDEMRALFPFINAGGDVFRAQVVGYYEGGAASSRAEVIFDATKAEPRVLFLRDISHLGRGYALETLGVQFSEEPLP